jgi:hypothetical protein
MIKPDLEKNLYDSNQIIKDNIYSNASLIFSPGFSVIFILISSSIGSSGGNAG